MSDWDELAEHWAVFRKHHPVGAYLPVGQLDGDCRECGGAWPCEVVVPLLDAVLKTRLAGVEALAARWRAEAAERGPDDTILTGGAAEMVLAALQGDRLSEQQRVET
jgi:hypothetical protein